MSKLAAILSSCVLLLHFSHGATPSAVGKWSDVRAIHVNPPDSRIIGGDEVAPHSIPYQVGLRINGNAFCGGFLITSNYVLTAGHCGTVIRTVDVILGAHNITDDAEPGRLTIPGEKTILHEEYDDITLNHDIALIKLSQSVELNDIIQVAKLPPREDWNRTYEYSLARSSGWGLTWDAPSPSTRDLSPVLQAVSVYVSNFDDCVAYYYDADEDVSYVRDTNVCTSGYKNKGTCNGDSGGPVDIDSRVAGITSFGTNLCETCAPSVYTRVANYIDWIEEHSDYKEIL